jgi:NADH-quinone oxidoreductase subunit C
MGIVEKFRDTFGEKIEEIKEFRGEITIYVKREIILEALKFLKNEGFDFLTDITAVDHPERALRFEVVYHLYSMEDGKRLRIKTLVSGEKPTLPSITGIWKGADWLEREVYDMFGIRFEGHPNLKRILLWDGFPGHPLRKDFPLREDVPLPEAE